MSKIFLKYILIDFKYSKNSLNTQIKILQTIVQILIYLLSRSNFSNPYINNIQKDILIIYKFILEALKNQNNDFKLSSYSIYEDAFIN